MRSVAAESGAAWLGCWPIAKLNVALRLKRRDRVD
jgi:hypothetical protein